ncbi:MAG: hypothetical protein C4532_18700, partial [Candidatus Abyssobacteria bacterium SURF_17]
NYRINAENKGKITRNLKDIFPEKSDGELREICRKNFINHAMHSLEILYLPSVNERFVKKYVRVINFDSPRKALEKGNGIVFILGHFGAYYISGITMQVMGVPMNDISQDVSKLNLSKLDRKILERRLNSYQNRISGKVFSRGSGQLLGVVKAIKRNEAISIFIESFTTDKDPVVNFLGRKTRFPQGPIRIALQTGAALLFSTATRDKNGVITVDIYDPLELETTGDKERDLQRNAQKCVDLLEPAVRQHPDQWHLWRMIHDRWVTENEQAQYELESDDRGARRRHDGAHSSLG